MSRPHRNPKSGVYFFRQKVPADLRDALGKTEVGWSLRTKDPEEAKLRHAEAARQQALRWAALRSRPEPVVDFHPELSRVWSDPLGLDHGSLKI